MEFSLINNFIYKTVFCSSFHKTLHYFAFPYSKIVFLPLKLFNVKNNLRMCGEYVYLHRKSHQWAAALLLATTYSEELEPILVAFYDVR